MEKIDKMFASFENALKNISKEKLDKIINRIDDLYSPKQQTVAEYFNSFEDHYEDLYQIEPNETYSALDFSSHQKICNTKQEKYNNPNYIATKFNLVGVENQDYNSQSSYRQAA